MLPNAAKSQVVTPPRGALSGARAKRPIFKKILLPIDFDRISIPAVKLAQTIARENDASVYVLYAVPTALRAQLDQLAEKNLLAIARKWFEGKVRNQVVVRSGKPVETVLKAADELGVDLVVMATHGRVGAKRARLGSVTEEVVRRATCPVLTIHPG